MTLPSINKTACSICETIIACGVKTYPLLIHEFHYSYLIFGNHQFYNGYSLLILKNHVRELHDLVPSVQRELFNELMIAGKAINQYYAPLKMNYASYGNLVEHIHWHIMPRYLSDPQHKEDPFSNAKDFEKFPTQLKQAQQDIPFLQNAIKFLQKSLTPLQIE